MNLKDAEEVYRKGRFVAYAVYDDNAMNPRTEWDTMGTMVFLQTPHWKLSDKNDLKSSDLYVYKWNDEEEYEEEIKVCLVDYAKQVLKAVAYIPLEYVSYSCSDVRIRECSEESAEGILYVTEDNLKEEYGDASEESISKAIKYMEVEIETFNQYLEGEVFGCVITDEVSGEDHMDSCWGFYGMDNKESGLLEYAKEMVDSYFQKEEERYQKAIKMPAWRFISEVVTNPF